MASVVINSGDHLFSHPDPCCYENDVLKIDKTVSILNGNFHHDILEILRKIRPTWKLSDVHTKEFTGGITNKLIGCWEGDDTDTVLIRIYGFKTETFIDREMERKCMQLLWPLGCGPQLYAIFHNGLCYRYLPGSHLDQSMVKDKKIYTLICKQMVRMHQAKLPKVISTAPCLFTKMWNFHTLISENFLIMCNSNHKNSYTLPSKISLKKEIEELENHLTRLKSPVVFCHNDALLRNIIYNEKTKNIAFIDFEYAGCNYQAFDIGNHFCEFAGLDDVDYSLYPDEKFQKAWLRTYLEFWYQGFGQSYTAESFSEEKVNILYIQVNKFALASHLMWGLWAIVQAAYSQIDFDYLNYANIRFTEYFARKKEYLALETGD